MTSLRRCLSLCTALATIVVVAQSALGEVKQLNDEIAVNPKLRPNLQVPPNTVVREAVVTSVVPADEIGKPAGSEESFVLPIVFSAYTLTAPLAAFADATGVLGFEDYNSIKNAPIGLESMRVVVGKTAAAGVLQTWEVDFFELAPPNNFIDGFTFSNTALAPGNYDFGIGAVATPILIKIPDNAIAQISAIDGQLSRWLLKSLASGGAPTIGTQDPAVGSIASHVFRFQITDTGQVCGDGVISGTEECDPPAAPGPCPGSCVACNCATGACCLDAGGCMDNLNMASCSMVGGYQGDGSTCALTMCKVIGPGLDCWDTGAACTGETRVIFGSPNDAPIPANFFGPGSNPFTGTVNLMGGLMTPDTLIQRMGPLALGVGSCDTVPIQLVQLSLQSCAPIMVTGGLFAGTWSMAVDLSPTMPPPGMMTVCKDTATGGTFTSTFNVQSRFTFTKLAPPNAGTVRVLDTAAPPAQPPISLTTVGTPPFLQPNPFPTPPCALDFAPGLTTIPMTTQPCCPETCHDNPAGGHQHCTRPPDCQQCPEEPNNDCFDRLPIGNGLTPFSTVLADTDGPDAGAGVCGPAGDGQVHNDIWYNYIASCTGNLRVTTCEELGGSANYDSRIAIYSGWTCPPGMLLGCNDDDGDGAGNPCGMAPMYHSTLIVPVTAGNQYKIRVGGFSESDSGTGTLNIACLPPSTCGNGLLEFGEDCDPPGSVCPFGLCQADCTCPPCDVTCAPGKTPENEANCGIPMDTVNGGCNTSPTAPIFSPLMCGQQYCGSAAYDGSSRDTDWYQLVLLGDTEITWSVSAEFDVVVGVVNTGGVPDCMLATAIDPAATAGPCAAASVTVCLTPGTWWLFVAPQFTSVVPCPSVYNASLTCGLCLPGACCDVTDGSCTLQTALQCTDPNELFQGSGTACMPGMCPDCGNGVIETGEDCDGAMLGVCTIGCNPDCTCSGPPNDDCADRIPIFTGLTPISTVSATTDGLAHPGSGCEYQGDGGQLFNDIWYNWTATCSGSVTFSLCNDGDPGNGDSTFDSRIAVYSNGTTSCATLPCPPTGAELIGCNDDGPACTGFSSLLTVPGIVAGNCYKVRVGGFGTGTFGTGNLAILCSGICGNNVLELGEECDGTADAACPGVCNPNCTCPCTGVGNDCCEGRTEVFDGMPAQLFDLMGATDDGPAEPSCSFPFGDDIIHQDLWYNYTATCNGQLFVDTCGPIGSPIIDTRLAVYEADAADCGSLPMPLQCNDDWADPTEADTGNACEAGLDASLSLPVTCGTHYKIRVGAFSSSGTISGPDQLNIQCVGTPCVTPCTVKADCADANDNLLRDDPCVRWICTAGACSTDPGSGLYGDIGGPAGPNRCDLDGSPDNNDAFHALNCFSNGNFGQPGTYPCDDANLPMNADIGGSALTCCPDGACDNNDRFLALTAFSAGGAPVGPNMCACPMNVPPGQPNCPLNATAPYAPRYTDQATLTAVPSTRTAKAGDLVSVNVFMENAVSGLQGYQLHLGVSGGRHGSLELVNINIADREDFVYSGLPVVDAYNLRTHQMLADHDQGAVATKANAYLATFTYRVSADAAGTFVIDVLNHSTDKKENRTFLFGPINQGMVELVGTKPAVIVVSSGRAQGVR